MKIRALALLVCGFVIAALASLGLGDQDKTQQKITKLYSVADLPVFKRAGDNYTFDTSIVTSLIRANLNEDARNRVVFTNFPAQSSIVVTGLEEDHLALKDVIAEMKDPSKLAN